MRKLTLAANYFICFALMGGCAVFATSLVQFQSEDLNRFICYLALAVTGGWLNVSLPAGGRYQPVNLLFVLIGVAHLTRPETIIIGALGLLAHMLSNRDEGVGGLQAAYAASNISLAILGMDYIIRSGVLLRPDSRVPVVLLVAAGLLFLLHELPQTLIGAILDEDRLGTVWRELFTGRLPTYIVCAALASFYTVINKVVGWQVAILAVPVVYLIYRAYALHVSRLKSEREHAEAMSSLHMRTIEALAMAIEAKDNTTHDHLQRVQVYAIEIGKELGLSREELEALRTASVLHDIGKLAVPEHIISKPGKLTPEEFEKMKIHPVVGAELIERVQFPYPVAPIVRSHHERWDGSGYPDGLKSDLIPIGARILAAVDCLDAMATDRQYRKALPLDEALARVVSESGTSFDPRVIEVLERRYQDLERLAQKKKRSSVTRAKLNLDMKVERGLAPAAGFEQTAAPRKAPLHGKPAGSFLESIAEAHTEAQTLFELAQGLGSSLSLDETLSVLAVRLERIIPFDAMAVFICRGDELQAEFVTGDNSRLLYSLRIPVGEGLAGWVVQNRKPIINGNPAVEPGYSNEAGRGAGLRSALAVPLEGTESVVGAICLYHANSNAFSKDHLRILNAVTSKVSVCVENALRFKQAEQNATTDYLTGLPNSRALFPYLDGELSRCGRSGTPLTVLVCDLDGFKGINDRFGHLVGNKLLQATALALKQHCRNYDYVARMGGDEFVIVMPGMGPRDVGNRRDQIYHAIQQAGLDTAGIGTFSMSIGEAHFPEDGRDIEQLLSMADRRMYRVKSNAASRRQAMEGLSSSSDYETNAVY
jgi:diguanylate cyclase (GGDEF)-like protein/putative nucleotidyltransferase with HDIG domain